MPDTGPAARAASEVRGRRHRGIILVLGGALVLGMRFFQASALAASTELHAKQYVTTITPQAGGTGLPVTLPGTLQGINEATVYARSNGYILRWTKDIGSSVRKGDLLAEITAPEVDARVIPGNRRAGSGGLRPESGEKHRGALEESSRKGCGCAAGSG